MYQCEKIKKLRNAYDCCFTLQPAVMKLQAISRQVRQMTPKMISNITRAKVSYICVTSGPLSPTSLHFTLRPSGFELQTLLRQVHQMTPRRPWTLQDQRNPYDVLLVCLSSNFQSSEIFSSTANHCRDTGLSKIAKSTELPPTDSEHLTVWSTLYTLIGIPETILLSISLYDQPFSRYSIFYISDIQ